MFKSKCDIIFDNETETYSPQQQVTGRVEFTFNSIERITGIQIRVKGNAFVSWWESTTFIPICCILDSFYAMPIMIHYKAQEEYFNYKNYLLGGENGEIITIGKGEHSFPFSFTLPQYIPSSFKSIFGQVKYNVEVVLKRPNKCNYSKKKPLNVLTPVYLNDYSGLKVPMKREKEIIFCYIFHKPNPVTIIGKLPYAAFIPGQSIPLQLECNNLSSSNIKSIRVELQQKITYVSTNCRNSRRVRKTVSKNYIGSVKAGENKTFQSSTIVPSLVPPTLPYCTIIHVDYELLVIVKSLILSRRALVFPIKIGTEPFDNVGNN